MKKTVLGILIAGATAFAGVNAAHAASAPPPPPPANASQGNAVNVVVKGTVAAITCDLGATGLGPGNTLDLGNWAATKFTDASTVIGTKAFTISFTNCDAGDPSKTLGLKVTGATRAGNDDIFTEDSGASVGVRLTTSGKTVKNGEIVSTLVKDSTTFSGASVPFNAGMIAPLASATNPPLMQDVKAILRFVADYS